ncbi:MAG: hypothetical protein JXB17_04675 [Bacteroidales bacterium]|nr:hypothetical protein [Bacteroidales bacterium]
MRIISKLIKYKKLFKIKLPVFILSIIFYISCFSLKSQDFSKYDNVFQYIQTAKLSDAYLILFRYQNQDPLNPNVYYQLGKIYLQWLKEYDPLTEYIYFKQFSYNANLYFGLSKHYLDDKSARKYREYFTDIKIIDDDKKIDYDDIINDIQNKLNEINEYTSNVNSIYSYFNKTITYYNNCIRLFKEINNDYTKIKEIYLLTNDSLFAKLDSISNNFDSVIYCFEKYQEKLKEFPIKNYNQEYSLKKIMTYRLDGLTNTDFLKNKIELWNYGNWVENIYNVINSAVYKLRAEIDTANKRLSKALDQINSSESYNDHYKDFSVDKNLLFKISKFDPQSIILDLFVYKANKINWLNNSYYKTVQINDTSNINFVGRARNFQRLVENKIQLDNKYKNINEKVNNISINKYYNFFQSNYSGIEGFRDYLEKEKQNNESILNNIYSNFEYFLVKEENRFTGEYDYTIYSNYNIPLFIKKPVSENLIKNQLYTYSITEGINGNSYISGIMINDRQEYKAYIANIGSNKKALWISFFDIKASPAYFDKISINIQPLDNNGCFAVISSNLIKEQENEIFNTLYRIGPKGDIQSKIQLYRSLIACFIKYDEINDNFIVAYKKVNENKIDELIIDLNDSLGNNFWSQIIEIEGDLIDIIKLNEDYLVYMNISQYTIQDGRVIYTKDDQNSQIKPINMLFAYIDYRGKIINLNLLQSEKSYYVTRIVKLSNNLINILGYINVIDNAKNKYNNEIQSRMLYMLVDPTGNVVYSNLN